MGQCLSNRCQFNLGWETRVNLWNMFRVVFSTAQTETRRAHKAAAPTHWNCVKAQALLNLLFAQITRQMQTEKSMLQPSF